MESHDYTLIWECQLDEYVATCTTPMLCYLFVTIKYLPFLIPILNILLLSPIGGVCCLNPILQCMYNFGYSVSAVPEYRRNWLLSVARC